jgi:hypothetical protein
VGDRDLRVVDVDAARTRVLSSPGNGRSYTDLRMSAHRVLAVIRNPCTADGYSDGVIAEVDPGSGELTALESGDALLPGSPTTVVDYDRQGATVLRDLGGKASTPVPQQWLPLARRGSSYAVYVLAADPGDPAALGTVGVGDPASGRLTTQYGSGSDVAASRDQVVWLAGGCDPGPCLLATTGADGIANAQPLSGRRPWSGVISPNGSQVAFRLTRTEGRLGGHPGPPNDVAVLDIRTGKLRILPGLVLPAKAGLTLAWSPDSTWLVIGADLGTRPLVMIWRTGMERPAQVQMPPTGGGTTGPPALLVL